MEEKVKYETKVHLYRGFKGNDMDQTSLNGSYVSILGFRESGVHNADNSLGLYITSSPRTQRVLSTYIGDTNLYFDEWLVKKPYFAAYEP